MKTKDLAIRALAASIPDEQCLDVDCRAQDVRDVLVPTVDDADLELALADIDRGDGGERKVGRRADGSLRRPKLHSAYSSCGLALNTFAPWRRDPSTLTMLGRTGYAELRFEEPLRIFRGGRAPNLDVVLRDEARLLAVESKLTEQLSEKRAPKFSEAYDRLESATHPSWWAIYKALVTRELTFNFLDAGQLVKHYFGIKARRIRDACLIYLYWEPIDGNNHREVLEHREEVARFAAVVRDPAVVFEPLSYLDLWMAWETLDNPRWLQRHVAALRERYSLMLK
jgi:hypothetical protein